MDDSSALYLGMLSGTSRDGADTVLVRFDRDPPELVACQCVAYPAELAGMLRRMIERRSRPDDEEMAIADRALAEFFALAAWGLLDRAGLEARDVTAIGSHGQTVWHQPRHQPPESIQLGDPQHIANLLGIPTVGRFRQADLAAGGQGAPLAPLLHRAVLRPDTGRRAVLNIGGIANVSLLEPDGGVTGFDTGPGNCLLDAWVREHQGSPYDEHGGWAAGGVVDPDLLQRLLADPYFSMRPPKSTGVEYFNFYWLQGHVKEVDATVRDIQATLSELTAASIARAVQAAGANELLVCGGGAHNADLMHRLERLLPGLPVATTAARGIDPDWIEGILFAWLARERLDGRLQDTRAITGARESVLLGEIYQPR
jgi:anhydro-N-acetylmuramic acid kinase